MFSNKLNTVIIKHLLVACCLLFSACATTFDKTNILPGQQVQGFGFSFEVPTDKAWFAVVYGTSNRIRLRQLNDDDSYSITISLNRGPRSGMYDTAQDHLNALTHHLRFENNPQGLIQHQHSEEVAPQYGKLCIQQSTFVEDWRGRNQAGPAMVETITLTCPHLSFDNVLISTEFSRRYEKSAAKVDTSHYAEQLFSSIEFDDID